VVTHEVDVRDWLSDLRSRKRWIDVVTVMRRHPASRRLAWRPYVFRPAHLPILVLVAALPLTFTRHGRRAWVGLLAAQVAYDVIRAPSPEAAVVKLQHRVNDAWEVALLARKSVEERTLLL
jgi:hypothetical protein